MSYKYNTRNTRGRYNNIGQFVSPSVVWHITYKAECGQPAETSMQQPGDYSQSMQYQSDNGMKDEKLMPPPPLPQQVLPPPALEMNDVQKAQEDKQWMTSSVSEPTNPGEETRPSWMKIKKISNKERRRRQNEHLRRLLTPKSAVMVLNEMLPRDALANCMKVRPMLSPVRQAALCVELTIDGVVYNGFGDNKVSARNSAAEQALRDLVINKISKLANGDGNAREGDAGVDADGAGNSETIPMIQLSSFALYKLFEQWESEGHSVPHLRPAAATTVEEECTESAIGAEGTDECSPPPSRKRKKVKKPKVLPLNASTMHPCMLLTYMRHTLEYRDVAAVYDGAPTPTFTVALDLDGNTYIGKALSKREARKEAARAACYELFKVEFEPNACELVPVPAPEPESANT